MICHDQRREGVLELTERNEQKSRRRGRREKEQLKLIKKKLKREKILSNFFAISRTFFSTFFWFVYC